jgi:uncharacterized protein (DUF58 family)
MRFRFPWPRPTIIEAPASSSAAPSAAALVRRVRRLLHAARPEALSRLAGAYGGARRGTGLAFAEIKPYEAGDDVRHLDWNVTARHGRPYVRTYIEERSLTFWLVMDVSASMRFGAVGRTKADAAARAAALLAAAATHNGDRPGLLLVSDQVEARVAPANGPRGLDRTLRTIAATVPRSRGSDLNAALDALEREPRAFVAVLSDFRPTPPSDGWRELARRHDLLPLRLIDPLEERLPEGAGLIAVADLISGRHMMIDARSRRTRAGHRRAAVERAAAFASWCRELGAVGHDIATDADPLPVLRTALKRRARRR